MLIQFIVRATTPELIESQVRFALEKEVNWIEIDAPDTVDDKTLGDLIGKLRPELAEKSTVLILGRRPELAKEAQADGVHIYTSDKPISAVRVAMEAWPIIGVNVKDLTQAEAMRALDIDYLFFESAGTPEDLETIREIAKFLDDNAVEMPLVVGGDITEGNIQLHVDAGATAIATSDPDTLGTLQHFAANLDPVNIV